jgi:hypothetical protein
MAYATDAELLAAVQFIRPDITTINTSFREAATTEVNGVIIEYSILPDNLTDYYDLLKKAEICFFLELMAMAGEIHTRFGDVTEEANGRERFKYNSGMPMFFFSSGNSQPFFQLLAHESYRMKGYKFARQYCLVHPKKNKARWKIWGVLKTDNTQRGYDWDNSGFVIDTV